MIDSLFREFGQAIHDIRSKLIDEGWFGRRAAPPSQFDVAQPGWLLDGPPPPRTGEERFALPSFEDAWATRDVERDPRDPGKHAGLDFDR